MVFWINTSLDIYCEFLKQCYINDMSVTPMTGALQGWQLCYSNYKTPKARYKNNFILKFAKIKQNELNQLSSPPDTHTFSPSLSLSLLKKCSNEKKTKQENTTELAFYLSK